jgi:hypothetical protein
MPKNEGGVGHGTEVERRFRAAADAGDPWAAAIAATAERDEAVTALRAILAIGELDADREVQVFDIVDLASGALTRLGRAHAF